MMTATLLAATATFLLPATTPSLRTCGYVGTRRHVAVCAAERAANDAAAATDSSPPPAEFFGDLPLPPAISAALRSAGVDSPTSIQEASSMSIYRGSHLGRDPD